MQRHNSQEQSQLSWKAPKGGHLCMNWAAWILSSESRLMDLRYMYILFYSVLCMCPKYFILWLNVWMQAWTLSRPIPSSLPGSFLLVPFLQSVFRGSQHNWEQLLCWNPSPAGRWERCMGRSAQCLELLLCKIWARSANEPNLTWFGAECWEDKSFFPRKTDSLSWRNCTVCDWV